MGPLKAAKELVLLEKFARCLSVGQKKKNDNSRLKLIYKVLKMNRKKSISTSVAEKEKTERGKKTTNYHISQSHILTRCL